MLSATQSEAIPLSSGVKFHQNMRTSQDKEMCFLSPLLSQTW